MVLGKCPETVYKALSIAFSLFMSPHHHVVNNPRPSRLLPEFAHVLFPRPGILVTRHYLVITSLSSCLSSSSTSSGRLLRLSRTSQDFPLFLPRAETSLLKRDRMEDTEAASVFSPNHSTPWEQERSGPVLCPTPVGSAWPRGSAQRVRREGQEEVPMLPLDSGGDQKLGQGQRVAP